MLYKVTPMMVPAAPSDEKKRERAQPRKRRSSAVYDADGNEVLISLMCLKCRTVKPLTQFGLRKMGDGAIRNQPWCRGCRGGAGTKKTAGKPEVVEATQETAAPLSVVPEPNLEAGSAPSKMHSESSDG
ncbi:MAG: hypothetical protein L0Y66_12640 [Myxococcaceae bacterium]|nr:hypothetical protein [Myxococcaceae bacterium]MCI0670719.1 hypothetical protein [Myxococcaceae bacterium]